MTYSHPSIIKSQRRRVVEAIKDRPKLKASRKYVSYRKKRKDKNRE